MKLSKPLRIAVGFATVWQAFYPLLFLAVWLFIVLGIVGFGFSPAYAPEEGIPLFPVAFLAIFPLHCLTMFLQMGLMVFYLVHVIKNTIASETLRIILGVGLFFMPFVSMPIYYYLYVWLDEPPEWARQQPGNQHIGETRRTETGDSIDTGARTDSATSAAIPDSAVHE